MNDQTLDKLEFDTIRQVIAEQCAGALGRKLALSMRPTRSPNMVKRWLGQVCELLRVSESIGLPPLGAFRDIREALQACGTPAGLDAEALAEVASTLSATGPLLCWAGDLPSDAVLLKVLADRIGDHTSMADKINECIDGRGRVRDEASPKLTSIRATIESAKNGVQQVFDRLLHSPTVIRYLQYNNATFHNDRKVLPLKAEHRGRVRGIIHRSSDTGSTLFVEPAEAVELNNTIVRLGMDEHKEISRILGELSREVHAGAQEIETTLNAIAILDLLAAKVRYANLCDAKVPDINGDQSLYLRAARHPVLEILHQKAAAEGSEPAEVVPIDIRLGSDFDVLMVTGPNTGGKTVALKTVGLLAVMTQTGIPIPVGEGSKMPVYNHIFVDIGDEQSIEQSLSTFSSHLQNQLEILRRAGATSLVLIDELGAGTDPDEGAAIGRAITEELLQLKVSAVLTTHLSALKAVAYTVDRVDNACVEFDAQTCKPTFHLRIGEPGNSNALTIAGRLGMPKRMIARAQTHLDRRGQALNKAIKGTLDSRRKAEQARAEAEQAKLDARESRDKLQKQTDDLAKAREAHDQWVAWINKLQAGDEVYMRRIGKPGKVVRVQWQKQAALVSAGTVDFEVGFNDLCPPDGHSK